MIKLDKPSFPPGWIFPGGAKILKRIDKQQFVEVFALDTDEYLYLFHENEIVKKLKHREISHEIFTTGGMQIVGKRYPDHKDGDIPERLKNLIQRRGLDAIAGMTTLKNTLIRDVDIDYEQLAKITDGLISSDVKLIVNNAALKALQGNVLISMKLLAEEADCFKPSLSQDDLNRYLEFQNYQRN